MDERTFFTHAVPKKFMDASLEKCDKQPQAFIDYAKSWALNPESVLLLGPVGRGKTQFAFAMIREMFRRNPKKMWPRYYTSPDIDSILLEAVKSETSEKFKIQEIASQDLIFIDDFGRETRSARTSRQYFELFNQLYANMTPTIVSTNLTLEEIEAQINDAVASRFQEWQVIEFAGPDLRIQRKIS